MKKVVFEGNDVYYICKLGAGAEFGDVQMVKDAWNCLLGYRQRLGLDVYPLDCKQLARAARKLGLVPYYIEQVHLLECKGSIGAKIARKEGYQRWPSLARNALKISSSKDTSSWYEVKALFDQTTILLKEARPTDLEGYKDVSTMKSSIWQWPSKVPKEW